MDDLGVPPFWETPKMDQHIWSKNRGTPPNGHVYGDNDDKPFGFCDAQRYIRVPTDSCNSVTVTGGKQQSK